MLVTNRRASVVLPDKVLFEAVRAGEDIRKSIHLGNVGEIWPLSLVAFLRAVSKSCAVFAAATIEFIGVFNV
jgi:hypothetical protein